MLLIWLNYWKLILESKYISTLAGERQEEERDEHSYPIFSVLLLLAIKLLQDIRLHNNTKQLLIR